jgi:MoaA/NifB/PqqE/SkfB family radical SAM enzyme
MQKGGIDITEDKLVNILNQHKRIWRIHLQGYGEPYIHKGYTRLCKVASEYAPVATITNGTIFDFDSIQYLEDICVSLDSLDPKECLIARGPTYKLDTVLATIEKLVDIGAPVQVNYTRSKWSWTQEKPIEAYCKSLGIQMQHTRVRNWFTPREPQYAQSHLDCLEERAMFGPYPAWEPRCPFRHGRYYYYLADGERHPCCSRPFKHQKDMNTPLDCASCPD